MSEIASPLKGATALLLNAFNMATRRELTHHLLIGSPVKHHGQDQHLQAHVWESFEVFWQVSTRPGVPICKATGLWMVVAR